MFLLIKSKTITYCTFKISAENVSQLKCDGPVFRLTVPVSESSCDEHRGLSPPRTIKYILCHNNHFYMKTWTIKSMETE